MPIPSRGTGPDQRQDPSRTAYQEPDPDADADLVEFDSIVGFDERGFPIVERRAIRVRRFTDTTPS